MFHYSTTIHRIQYAVRAKGLTFVEFENKLGVKRKGLIGRGLKPPKLSTFVRHSFRSKNRNKVKTFPCAEILKMGRPTD